MSRSPRIQISLSEKDMTFLMLKKAESGESFPQIIKRALHDYEAKNKFVKSHTVIPGEACQTCEDNGFQRFSKKCFDCEKAYHKFEFEE